MSMSRFLRPSWSLNSTVTCNNEVSTLPASYLLLPQHTRFYRSSTLSTIQMTFDASVARSFDGVFFGYHNGSATGTIRITANASTGTLFSGPSFDSTAQSIIFSGDLSSFESNHIWYEASSLQTYRYVGIEISDGSNPDGYVQAGIIQIGEIFTPTIGEELGATFGQTPRSETIELVSGETIKGQRRAPHTRHMLFPKQNIANAAEFWHMQRVYGDHTPVVYKRDYDDANYEQEGIYYGYLDWRDESSSVFHGDELYDITVGIREI